MSISGESLTLAARGRANAEGRCWALGVRTTLVSDRRRPCGGWPGTLSEARARVALAVFPWQTFEGEEPPTPEQREDAARLVYASARSTWMMTRDDEEV